MALDGTRKLRYENPSHASPSATPVGIQADHASHNGSPLRCEGWWDVSSRRNGSPLAASVASTGASVTGLSRKQVASKSNGEQTKPTASLYHALAASGPTSASVARPAPAIAARASPRRLRSYTGSQMPFFPRARQASPAPSPRQRSFPHAWTQSLAWAGDLMDVAGRPSVASLVRP